MELDNQMLDRHKGISSDKRVWAVTAALMMMTVACQIQSDGFPELSGGMTNKLPAEEISNRTNTHSNSVETLLGPSREGLVLELDAARPSLSITGPACNLNTWFDLSASTLVGVLNYFGSCSISSGWNGGNEASDPRRLTFDGKDDYVDLGAHAALDLGLVTIEAWVRPHSFTNWGSIYNRRPSTNTFGVTLEVSPEGKFQIYHASASLSLMTPALGQNKWHHVIGIVDGERVRLYLNGQERGSVLGGKIGSGIVPARIGQNIVSGEYFHGDIARVAVYDRAFSTSEVKDACMANYARFANFSCR